MKNGIDEGFPAHAGMDPPICTARFGSAGVPRTRGDGPRAGAIRAGPRAEIPAWDYFGETEGAVEWSLWYHAEVFLTRPVRDGFAVRLGARFTPLLYLPLTAQPVVMGVWRF